MLPASVAEGLRQVDALVAELQAALVTSPQSFITHALGAARAQAS